VKCYTTKAYSGGETSGSYGFQGLFRPQRVLKPPWKKLNPPGQIFEYTPAHHPNWVINR